MAKLQLVLALLLCLSIIPNINSQMAQQICPRFLCEAWTPLQNVTTPNQIPTSILNSIMSQFRTGLNPNSQICFQANSSTNANGNAGVTQYFMHTCPYPNYFCGLSLVPPTSNGGAAVAQTTATCQLKNQTNLLGVGDWCYSNSDCYSGLCDNRNQGVAGSTSTSSTAWATALGLNVQWSNPFQQGQYFAQQNQFNAMMTTTPFFSSSGTNKCFVRKYNESCTNHQQCGMGLRCATNPWQASTTSEPQYICMPQLTQGSACGQAGYTSNQININMNSWELCPYGTACVTSGSSQGLNTNSFVCTTKYTISNSYYFQFPPGYVAYTTYYPRMDGFLLPPVATQPVGTAQSNEMCASNVSLSISTTQFQCLNPYQSLGWQSQPCQRPTDCACTDQIQCTNNLFLQQSCTCAIFNTNGSAYCKGYSGNQAITNGMTPWSNVLSQFTVAYANYSKVSSNPGCYNYQLFDQYPWTSDWLFPQNPPQCRVQGITFGNPGPYASRPSCLEATFKNPMLVAPQAPFEIDMMENFYGNGSLVYNNKRINPSVEGQNASLFGWIPYSPNQQNVPGGANTRTSNTAANPAIGDNWNAGTCPQWICQNVTTSTQFNAAQLAQAQQYQFSSFSNFFPVMRGACALYDWSLNQWSMRVCRSSLDECVPCLPGKCGGYANYTVNAQNQAQGNNLGTFAFKCLRMDGTKKRVFEDCWDDSDCLSMFCSWPGYCTVRSVGQTCFQNANCDRNLQCVYNPTYGTQSTCQPAIIANGYCDQNSWQQCKFGSQCLLVTGEFYPRCVNMYSLPGQTTFSFIGIDLTTISNVNYAQMCSSGYYQDNPLNAPTYVNYTGCLILPPKTYGGWPKQCLQNSDCSSMDLVSLQGQVVNALSQAANNATNGICACDNLQQSPFWMGNTQGQMFCQGFDGERNDLQRVLRQGYERDFANCYPYEIQNINLTQLGYLGGFCGQQIINWYDPAPSRPIGSCYQQWFQDVDILSRSANFTAWAKQQGYSPANSFLFNLFSRCPVYTCQNSSIQAPYVQNQNSICRYFNETTNQIQLFGCPGGQSCNQYNSTFWLCDWNPSLQKNLSQVCTFDIECITQYCDPQLFKCSTKSLYQQCDVPVQCGQNLICGTNSSLYQGTSAQVQFNRTNVGTQCLTPLAVLAVCKNVQQGLDMTTLCPYGTKCILTSNQTISQNWQCVPYYSLGPAVSTYNSYVSGGNLFVNSNAGSNVIINILQPVMSQADLNMMCQTGFYFQDPTVTSTASPPLSTQQMGYCAFNKLWTNGKPAYKQQCMSNQDCVNNFNYTLTNPTSIQGSNAWLSPSEWYYKGNSATLISTFGTCSCQFINDQGSGWCQPMPSDQEELPGWTQFYANGMKNCYPFEYLTGLNIQSTSCSLTTFGITSSVYANYATTLTTGTATQTAFNTCIKQVFPFASINSGFNLQILPQYGYQYPTNFTTFCPAHQCLNGSTNPFSICFQYTSTNVIQFQKCANTWESCQFYNTTLGLCWNQTMQKNFGDNCMFDWQCRSNMCSSNGTCIVANLNQSCIFHQQCNKNLRCSLPGVLNANIFMGKQCVTAIPSGGICQPWSFDQCKFGSSCILINGQSQPVCTQYYSLQGGSQFVLITNFSQYNNSNYHPSMQATFNQMCASGLYDPVQGCRALPEVTQGGWPKACQTDTDCNGARYGTAGVCTCTNPNTQGTGYCAGFQDEQNNITATLVKNFQRSFSNCYPYEINTYFLTPGSDYTQCGRYDYATWHSAPGSVFGNCYPSVSLPYWTGSGSSLSVNFILAIALLILMIFKF